MIYSQHYLKNSTLFPETLYNSKNRCRPSRMIRILFICPLANTFCTYVTEDLRVYIYFKKLWIKWFKLLFLLLNTSGRGFFRFHLEIKYLMLHTNLNQRTTTVSLNFFFVLDDKILNPFTRSYTQWEESFLRIFFCWLDQQCDVILRNRVASNFSHLKNLFF